MNTEADHEKLFHLVRLTEASFDPFYGEAWNAAQFAGIITLPTTHALFIDPDGKSTIHPTDFSVGYALSRRVLDEEELLLFAIEPEFRGRGLGLRLLEDFIAAARKAHLARVFLEMRVNNSAVALYDRIGFIPHGRRRNYYRCADGTKLDALSFTLVLSPG